MGLNSELRRPVGVAAGLFLVLWGLALARAWALEGSFDLAYFTQASWLIRNGEEAFVSVRALHLLGDHGSFVFYPMALTAGWLGAPGLLGLQAALLASGVVPLWLIARRLAELSKTATTALIAAYALYPALSNVNLFDFHPEAVAVPALLTAAYIGLRQPTRHLWLYTAAVAATLTAREDLAIPVACLGLLVAAQGKRRLGIVTTVAAAAWLVLDLTVVLPHFAGGEYAQANRFGQYGDTLGEAVKFMATHPLTVLGDAATKPNLTVIVGLFAPVLFLPARALRYLLPGLPLQAAYLLTNVEAAHTIDAQYTVSTIPFVFLATAMALRRWDPEPPRRLLRAIPAAALATFLVLGNASPRDEPWRWATQTDVDRARRRAADLVPDDAAVTATVRMWPLLAERRHLYPFPRPLDPYIAPDDDDPAAAAAARRNQTRWVVLDTADGEQWTPLERRGRDRHLAPGNPLGFTKVFDEAGIQVFAR